VVVACAATLHRDGRSIHDAADAAVALQPLAGTAASTLFAVGLIGAAFLAASILPLSTAYSVCEYAGIEAAVDDPYSEARPFYLTFGIVTLVGALTVLIPNIPLVTILIATRCSTPCCCTAVVRDDRHRADRDLMGRFTIGPASTIAYFLITAVVVLWLRWRHLAPPMNDVTDAGMPQQRSAAS
jgi:Mn2+/Fe2+ NRAMP family transporter